MSILKNCTLIVPTFQQSKPDCDVWILFISTKFPQTYLPASIYYNVDHVLTQFMKHEHKHYLRWWYTFLHDIMVYIIYYSLVVIEAQLVHVIWPSASCYVELQPYWQHKQYTQQQQRCSRNFLCTPTQKPNWQFWQLKIIQNWPQILRKNNRSNAQIL